MTIERIIEGNGWKAELKGESQIHITMQRASGTLKLKNAICENTSLAINLGNSVGVFPEKILKRLRKAVYHEIRVQLPKSERHRLGNYGRPLNEIFGYTIPTMF